MIGLGGEPGVTGVAHVGHTEEAAGEAEMRVKEVEQDGLCQGNGDGGCTESLLTQEYLLTKLQTRA